MTYVLIFQLLSGDVAEMTVTDKQCRDTLELAAGAGGVSIKLSGGKQEIVPAWRVVCVERVTAR